MASRRLVCCVLVAWLACVALAEDKTNELGDDSPESSCDHDPANAVLFPFVFLAIGAATLYLTSRYAPDVPYTVLMLCWGFLIDWWASIDDTCPINALQDSIYLWSNIDGDMVLLIFLPALLFGDAMSINVHQFLRAFWQCALLAGPGVVCSALLTAVMMLEASPYHFPFSLAMTQGAILAIRPVWKSISRRFSNHGLRAIDATAGALDSLVDHTGIDGPRCHRRCSQVRGRERDSHGTDQRRKFVQRRRIDGAHELLFSYVSRPPHVRIGPRKIPSEAAHRESAHRGAFGNNLRRDTSDGDEEVWRGGPDHTNDDDDLLRVSQLFHGRTC